ncbi:MAG: 2OG-Fe(II) oxygenase [Actinomycetota bacterium]|nr:2OG-Fe(II) oxygenase [Actinomycetota bacterium]
MSIAPADLALPTLDRLDWPALEARLDESGFAMTPPLLTPEQCTAVRDMFDDDERFRSTVVMARHAYGEGSYRYFADPLPPLVQGLRTALYPPIAQTANRWADRLGDRHYPENLDGLLDECASLGQRKPTPLVLRYGPGGYNCLHQDVYGELTFPLQLLIMLSTPDVDFTGGESVFVEQRPRQQSRAMVARPGLGQAVVFAVRHRPRRGTRGYHRVQLRHGVSAVHTGDRHVLGIIFHNAR